MVQENLEVILERYTQARLGEPFSGNHELCAVFESIREELFNSNVVRSRPNLRVKYSVGQGNWARVPWIAFLDERETTSTQKGVYCVYLFRQDMSGVYVTFNQGVTELIRQNGRPRAHQELRRRAEAIHQYCNGLLINGFSLGTDIDLCADPGLGSDYEYSTIAHKFYAAGRIPEESTMVRDLEMALNAYNDYMTKRLPILTERPAHSQLPIAQGGEKEIVRAFYQNATDLEVGLKIRQALATNAIASLLAKRFLLLTGLSGSGKTKLAHTFAIWISESPEQYRLVAVGADWTSNENLLGYQDALQPTIYRKPASGALDLILRARNDKDRPYFLILDEMNLSHVERYFADILSSIESGEEISLHSAPNDLNDGDYLSIPPKFALPDNLFIIGTVNVDETTYMFSPKVLDRANVIEFRATKEDIVAFLESPTRVNLAKLAGKGAGYGVGFVKMAAKEVAPSEIPAEIADGANVAEALKARLTELFEKFAPIGAEFGFRTTIEISRFVFYHAILSGPGWDFKDALDAQVVQKLMPKLHGSDRKLRPPLEALKAFCTEYDLRISLEKTNRMLDRLKDGFTSFAEA